jgi:hypothetical protein
VYPEGYLEDVLVQVEDLIFPADFLVLEMEHEPMPTSLPLIFGRGFMRTAHTKIDVFEGTLTMEFEETKISFNIFEAKRYPVSDSSQNIACVETNGIVQATLTKDFGDDPSTKEPIFDVKGVVMSAEPVLIDTVIAPNILSPDKGRYAPTFEVLSCSHISHTSVSDKLTPVGDKFSPTRSRKRRPPPKSPSPSFPSNPPKKRTSSYDPPDPPDPNKKSFMKKTNKLMYSSLNKDHGMFFLL